MISIRGKPRYAVINFARYDFLRVCEIAAARVQTRKDVTTGSYRRENADVHTVRVKSELSDALWPDLHRKLRGDT